MIINRNIIKDKIVSNTQQIVLISWSFTIKTCWYSICHVHNFVACNYKPLEFVIIVSALFMFLSHIISGSSTIILKYILFAQLNVLVFLQNYFFIYDTFY